jgi:hypothetical protein
VVHPELLPQSRAETPNIAWRDEMDEELMQSAKGIEDEELREEFVKMAAKLSAREKRMNANKIKR